MPTERRVDRPIILGIVGDSAAGKTTLAAGIAQILGDHRVVHLCTDDYHRYTREERAARNISALHPEANHIDIIEQHLRHLRQGEAILKPVYDHRRGTREAPQYVAPKSYIIIEGLLGYATRAMRECYDVKVYLEPDEALRQRWKIQRDTRERGYSEQQVRQSLDKRQDDRTQFIEPQRTFADMVVSFTPPDGDAQETGAHLTVRHTLRPTLPHPDLTPLLDAGTHSAIRLELQRDLDGKPVDVLEIPGDIDRHRAHAMEDLLWTLIPEAAHLRENVGRFTDARNNLALSHPLALSQLMIAYHMVKAALGHHAV